MLNLELYLITDRNSAGGRSHVEIIGAAIAAGAGVVQLRDKKVSDKVFFEEALALRQLTRDANVAFIVNDRIHIALAVQADGVHIGQDDGSLAVARKIMGAGKIIGRSTHSLEQARAALAEGFDYIGFGPLFPTPTKLGRPGIGLQDITAMERDVGSRIPAFCIGGIKRSNLREVLAAGARRVVIVSDLLTAADVRGATREACGILLGASG